MTAIILRVLWGFFLAAAAASFVFAAGAFSLLLRSGSPLPDAVSVLTMFIQAMATTFVPLAGVAFLPSMIVAAIAEKFHFRSLCFYLPCAVVVAIGSIVGFRLFILFMMQQPKTGLRGSWYSVNWMPVIAGLVAGLVYWAVAGRKAGAAGTRSQ